MDVKNYSITAISSVIMIVYEMAIQSKLLSYIDPQLSNTQSDRNVQSRPICQTYRLQLTIHSRKNSNLIYFMEILRMHSTNYDIVQAVLLFADDIKLAMAISSVSDTRFLQADINNAL